MKIGTIKLLIFTLLFSLSFKVYSQNNTNIKVSCPEAAKYYAKDSINIVTFGASTVEGVKGLGFQEMLSNNFKNCYDGKVVDITNHGIGGQTTAQGVLRIANAIKDRTGFIIIDMGINDAFAIIDNKIKIAETEANMRILITAAKAQKLVPILCTLQFVDDRNIRSYVAVNNNIRSINTIYKKLAVEYNIYLADVNAAIRRDFSLYQDPLHPNARGYRLMSYVLFDAVNKAIFDRFLQFVVSQNYPNPAVTKTYLDIVLPESDKINVQVYNILGQVVKSVVNEYLNTGKHTLEVSTEMMIPGVYFFKISSDSGLYNATKKFIVMR